MYEAIVWGRAQADVVVVMVCDDAGGASYFSAGELEPPTWEAGTLYPWPVSGDLLTARRVASGRRDASVEVSGVWEVELVAYGDGDGDGGEAPQFAREWSSELGKRPDVAQVVECEPASNASPSRLAIGEGEFWARTVLPSPLARAGVLVMADSRDDAERAGVRAGARARSVALQLGVDESAIEELVRARAERRLA